MLFCLQFAFAQSNTTLQVFLKSAKNDSLNNLSIQLYLLPDTALPGAMGLAQQLGAAVHALQIEHGNSTVDAVVTVSLGVCSKPEQGGGSADALLRAADAQLYRAKTLGRHQVCGAQLAPA